MQNLHKHSSYSNIYTADSACTNEDYAKRAVELGHKVISSVEHGWQGYYFQCFELAKKYDLKFVFGVEAYWVKDRQKEYFTGLNKKGEETFAKDRSNHHILILAKNEKGRQAINDALSEANITGYYFRPRLDLELILNLPPDDVFVTSACIAFNGYEDIDDIILQFHNHFKENFMLEIQYHNTEKQKVWNRHLKELAANYGIELIVGLDSHMIHEEDAWQRDAILEAKGIIYEDEQGWLLDYPDDETTMNRFLEQGIFTREEVQKAMDNTDIALTFDDYDDVPIFNKDIKLPTLYPDLTTEEKNKLYRKLIGTKFNEYMKNIPKEDYQRYYDGVLMEIQTYEDTGMVDYPLLDYEIVKDAVEHGGLITDTGRGCFTGGSIVKTKNGIVKIYDVKIGDYVQDINGEFKKVLDTMYYDIEEEMIAFCHSDRPFASVCTLDHKILISDGNVIKWVEAQNLKTNYYVLSPYKGRKGEYLYHPITSITKLPKQKVRVYDLTVEDSHSYVLDNMIVHNSAVGYFTNTLCGFSKVDRFKSAIKLYPERFISTTRILQTHSLPDIDLNVGTPEIFEESQIRVLGEEHVAPMIAFGTLKKKSAFKIYAKAKGLDFQLSNAISEQIGDYDEAVKNADDEEEKASISIYDFVDENYKQYIEDSKEYWGIISDKKKAPSAYLLYQGNIRKEIGLIKCKSESTKKEYVTCVMDGAIAENYKFLKNDLLTVSVVLLIDKVFKRIGIEHFDVNTLIEKVTNDQKVWDLYANGYTVGINQVEQDGSRKKCMNYKPKNISELSAFVAAIRPGFKSMYKRFENREDFKYGINALDNLVQTEELPVSFLFFQEQCMSVLHYAGFPMDECYGIIKSIAKKHPEKVLPLKQQFLEGFKKQVMIDEDIDEKQAEKYSADVWQIISDNVNYSFNSAHAYCMALDSLYQAWQKAHYPYEFYEVLLQFYSDKGNKAKVAALKSEMKKGFGIKEGKYKFGNDNRTFSSDQENGVIYPSLASIKNISQKTANSLYKLSKNHYDNFIDLLIDIKKEKINTRQMSILVKLDYFEQFGEINQLLAWIELFEKFYSRKQIKKNEIEELNLSAELVQKYSNKVTEKQYSDIDMIGLIKEQVLYWPFDETSIAQKAYYQWRYLGYIDIVDEKYKGYLVAMSVNAKYSPRLNVYSLGKGTTTTVKIPKPQFRKLPIEEGNVFHALNQKKKIKVHMTADGDFAPTVGEYDWWITDYDIIKVQRDL